MSVIRRAVGMEHFDIEKSPLHWTPHTYRYYYLLFKSNPTINNIQRELIIRDDNSNRNVDEISIISSVKVYDNSKDQSVRKTLKRAATRTTETITCN